MPRIKNYWLQEVAKAFGMDVSKLAEFLGYSRQSLYLAANGRYDLNKGRLSLAIFKLEMLNEKQFKAEKEKAEANYEHRKKMIEDLVERLG